MDVLRSLKSHFILFNLARLTRSPENAQFFLATGCWFFLFTWRFFLMAVSAVYYSGATHVVAVFMDVLLVPNQLCCE